MDGKDIQKLTGLGIRGEILAALARQQRLRGDLYAHYRESNRY